MSFVLTVQHRDFHMVSDLMVETTEEQLAELVVSAAAGRLNYLQFMCNAESVYIAGDLLPGCVFKVKKYE